MFRIIKDKIMGRRKGSLNSTTEKWELKESLEQNIKMFEDIFKNDDTVIYRRFETKGQKKIKCCAIFIDGMVNNQLVNEDIIKPIILFNKDDGVIKKYVNLFKDEVIMNNDAKEIKNVEMIVSQILYGQTAILVDGMSSALLMDTKGWERRAIEEPPSEAVVRGPKEGFTETLMINLSMIRRKIQNPHLKFKFMELGRQTRTKICVCHIDGIADEQILNEVNKRLEQIDIDAILESGYVEELIKDSPLSPFTTVGNSERPDVIAGNLLEGRIAIAIDGTPHVLTVPYLFIEYFQANEDYYNSFLYSSVNRMLRVLGFFIATSVPAIYVALTTFHQEMIPTPLLLAIAAAREGVPFPTVVEALLMLLAFEILRESGVRLPAPIGSAISFVGALILGEAAVSARFVSAPIVIVTALTGISNFLIPKMIGALILIRLSFLVLSSFLGLYGYIFGVIGLFIHLMSMRSFGIPYMLNIGDIKMQEIKDTAIRAPWWLMYFRPKLIGSNNPARKKDTIIPEKR